MCDNVVNASLTITNCWKNPLKLTVEYFSVTFNNEKNSPLQASPGFIPKLRIFKTQVSLRYIIFLFSSLAFLRGQILLFYLDASRECIHPLIETSSRGSYNSSEFDLDISFLLLRSLFPLEVI